MIDSSARPRHGHVGWAEACLCPLLTPHFTPWLPAASLWQFSSQGSGDFLRLFSGFFRHFWPTAESVRRWRFSVRGGSRRLRGPEAGQRGWAEGERGAGRLLPRSSLAPLYEGALRGQVVLAGRQGGGGARRQGRRLRRVGGEARRLVLLGLQAEGGDGARHAGVAGHRVLVDWVVRGGV